MALAKNLGYTKPLFILAFDHRSSFLAKMFGLKTRPVPGEVATQIQELKQIIFMGFKEAVTAGIPKARAAILVEEEFGDAVLREAVSSGYTVLLTTEKSGQEEFDFEYGEAYAEHINKYRPQMVKALVRFNPEGDRTVNEHQTKRLKVLSDFCHANGYKFLIEPLLAPTAKQLSQMAGSIEHYDEDLRPALTVKMMQELQGGGVEPDVWKLEGLARAAHYEPVVAQAQSSGRDGVSVVVLGRGEDAAKVEVWLKAGAKVQGVIGFAIGRTIFWEALVDYKEKRIDRKAAVRMIAKNYQHFYEVFNAERTTNP